MPAESARTRRARRSSCSSPYTLSVGFPERRQQVTPDLTRGVDGQSSMLREMALEGVALQVVHHIEVQAILFMHRMHGNDVRMPQIREDASFVDKLVDGLRRPQLGPQHFDGNEAVEGHVARQVDGSHAAASELGQQLVLRRQSRTQALREGRHVTWTGEHSGRRPESQTAPEVRGRFTAALASRGYCTVIAMCIPSATCGRQKPL